jgi:hypothetical protein
VTDSEQPEVTDVPEPDQEPHEPVTDEADEEEEVEAEPEPEEPVAQGFTPEQWDKAFKSIEKSYTTYTNAVSRNLEEAAQDYLPCPLCADTPAGFIHPSAVGTFPPEVTEAVDAILGRRTGPTLKQAQDTEQCITCGGIGKLATKSLVPEWSEKVCGGCGGAGFTGPGNPMFSPATPAVVPVQTGDSNTGLDLSAALAAVSAAASVGNAAGS